MVEATAKREAGPSGNLKAALAAIPPVGTPEMDRFIQRMYGF